MAFDQLKLNAPEPLLIVVPSKFVPSKRNTFVTVAPTPVALAEIARAEPVVSTMPLVGAVKATSGGKFVAVSTSARSKLMSELLTALW